MFSSLEPRIVLAFVLGLFGRDLKSQDFVPTFPIQVQSTPEAVIQSETLPREASSASVEGGELRTKPKVAAAGLESADGRPMVCQPQYADEAELKIPGGLAVLLTHFTERLDKERETRSALRTITNVAKSHKWPLVYLHEGNAAPEDYFYCDCEPTAFVNSSLGRFQFATDSLDHVIIAGGFYELCLDNTFSQIIENWSNVRERKELRITFVMDAIYGVASDSLTDDGFNAALRDWIRNQPDQTVLMSDVLDRIGSRDGVWTFLSRRWTRIPASFGLHVRYQDEITAVRFAQGSNPTVVIHYTTAAALARSVDQDLGQPLPIELSRIRRSEAANDGIAGYVTR